MISVFGYACSILEDRDQGRVDLHRDHSPRRAGQMLGQRPDPGSDLQDKIFLSDPGRLQDLIQHMGIDQEILSEPFLEHKCIFF